MASFVVRKGRVFRSNSSSQSLCRDENEQSGMEEHGEELQNNGQASKVATKQIQIGSELDYSYNDSIATHSDPGIVT